MILKIDSSELILISKILSLISKGISNGIKIKYRKIDNIKLISSYQGQQNTDRF